MLRLLVLDIDSFDRRILAVLRDGESGDFPRLLREVGFSHNTLMLRLTSLKRQDFILETKKHKEGSGRFGFTYSLPPDIKYRVALTLTDPYITIVSLTFQKLRYLCRFEKDGYCKNMRRRCETQNCPQIIKGQ